MRTSAILCATVALLSWGCGSGDEHSPASKSPAVSNPEGYAFNPPAALDGYTRITAATIHGIEAGSDITYCQYVMAPVDHDQDVLGTRGYQSAFGHHAVAFTYTPQPGDVPGSSFPCMGTEFSAGSATDGGAKPSTSLAGGAFLGAASSPSGGPPPVSLPDGVAIRLNKGNGIMLNLHYLNTGDKTIDGDAVVDLKLADPDPSRRLAAMFINVNFGFDLPPASQTTSSVDCVAQSDVEIIMMSNHMHEFGTSASTSVLRGADGSTEDLHDDPTWTYDMQFNPTYTRWEVTSPFTLHAGDAIRTSCSWKNSSDASISFPREMCISAGFALAHGDNPKAPGACFNGAWIAGGF
jgi:hypothetical protein